MKRFKRWLKTKNFYRKFRLCGKPTAVDKPLLICSGLVDSILRFAGLEEVQQLIGCVDTHLELRLTG